MNNSRKVSEPHGFTDYTLDVYTVTNVPCVHNPVFGEVIKGKDMYRTLKLIEYMRKNHLQVLAFDTNVME